MELQIFDKELFKKVIKTNLDTLVNTISVAAEYKSIGIGSPIKTEDETRIMAFEFFRRKLSEYLTNQL